MDDDDNDDDDEDLAEGLRPDGLSSDGLNEKERSQDDIGGWWSTMI